MGLDAARQVMKSSRVGDISGDDAAGQIRDLVGHAPPGAAALLGGGVRRRVDGVPLDDQRVQVDHLHVVVQEVDDDLARDARRQRRDGRERAALRHGHCAPLTRTYDDFFF